MSYTNENGSEIEKLQIAYLDNMRNKTEAYNLKYGSYEITILPNVFPPYIENRLIIDHVVFDKNDRVLDICSGSGILSIHAGLNCKEVIATDINPHAIKNIKINAKKYNIQHKVQAIKADTYPKNSSTKFNKILSIPPFSNKKANSIVEKSVWDYKHKTIKKIFAELKNHLTQNGELYLIWSSIGGFDTIFSLNKKYKYNIKEMALVSDALSTYKLFKITLAKNNNSPKNVENKSIIKKKFVKSL